MTRKGKIARLPAPIREQANRRLDNGENGRAIVAWLNAMDEVKAVLTAEFDGQPINDVNLCAWRQGGFRDWEMLQATLAETERVVTEGLELEKIGEKSLGDKVAAWVVDKYMLATRKLTENGDAAGAWKLLRELCQDVVRLRRGDHEAEWLRMGQEKLKLLLQRQPKGKRENKEPAPPLSDGEKDRKYAEIFGFNWDTHPMNPNKKSLAPETAPTPAAAALGEANFTFDHPPAVV